MRLNAQKIYKDGYLKDNYSEMPLQARQGAIIALALGSALDLS